MESLDPTSEHELATRMAELAREIATPRSLHEVLADVTATAIKLIPAADIAGVLLLKGGGEFDSVADTDSLVAKLDKLQHDFGEGPCHDAALKQTIVRTDDLRVEPRWPNYAPAAVEHGVLSSLSFKLYTAERTAGALNLFSFRPDVWDTEAETIGSVFAAHAASALLARRRKPRNSPSCWPITHVPSALSAAANSSISSCDGSWPKVAATSPASIAASSPALQGPRVSKRSRTPASIVR